MIKLDSSNLSKYINLDDIVDGYKYKEITNASLSDIIRLLLLKKYGGLWVDSTIYCNQPLSTWFGEWETSEFCALPKNRKKTRHMIASFFLYSKANSYIIKKWCDEAKLFWSNINKTDSYSWVHLRFCDAYDKDEKFRNMWGGSECKKFKWYVPGWNHENGVGFLAEDELVNELNSDIFNVAKKSVACKLTYKLNDHEIKKTSIYNYII